MRLVNAGGRGCVAAHYGSPAGELAACVKAVGLADCSNLTKLEVTGESGALEELVHVASHTRLYPGGCVLAGGAWWCAASAARLVVLAEPDGESPLVQIRRAAMPDVEVSDRSTDWAAIAVVGKRTVPLLVALGAVTDPRLHPPFGPVTVGRTPAELLMQSDRQGLLIVTSSAAAPVWQAIEKTGRPLGLANVGSEAISRFALLERLPGGALATHGD